MSLDNPFVALEPAIIAACANHEKDHHQLPSYRRFIRFANYFIKFGDSWCFSSEVQTHDRFAKVTEKDLTAPRVPLIRHSFKHGHLTFAVRASSNLASLGQVKVLLCLGANRTFGASAL